LHFAGQFEVEILSFKNYVLVRPQKFRANVEFVAVQNCFVLFEVLRQISNMIRVEATQRRFELLFDKTTLIAVHFEHDMRLFIRFIE
jgi:hypothetical protein